jgi:hypothetical protein
LVQLGIAELEGRLGLAWRLHLTQQMGDVIGAEGTGGESFLQSGRDLFRAISAEQIQQLVKLPEKRAVGVGQTAQISVHRFR